MNSNRERARAWSDWMNLVGRARKTQDGWTDDLGSRYWPEWDLSQVYKTSWRRLLGGR